MTEQSKGPGQPTIYNEEVVSEICSRIADGESLRSICRDDSMPAKSTVLMWLADEDKAPFLDQYARAREAQADALFDEIVSIADSENGDDVQRARLRVDARKWVAGKLRPKKYGDKQQHEVTGADGGPVKTHNAIEWVVVDPHSQT